MNTRAWRQDDDDTLPDNEYDALAAAWTLDDLQAFDNLRDVWHAMAGGDEDASLYA